MQPSISPVPLQLQHNRIILKELRKKRNIKIQCFKYEIRLDGMYTE